MAQETTSKQTTPAFFLATSGVLVTCFLAGGIAIGLGHVAPYPEAASSSAVSAHDHQAPLPETLQTLGVMYPNGGHPH